MSLPGATWDALDACTTTYSLARQRPEWHSKAGLKIIKVEWSRVGGDAWRRNGDIKGIVGGSQMLEMWNVRKAHLVKFFFSKRDFKIFMGWEERFSEIHENSLKLYKIHLKRFIFQEKH